MTPKRLTFLAPITMQLKCINENGERKKMHERFDEKLLFAYKIEIANAEIVSRARQPLKH